MKTKNRFLTGLMIVLTIGIFAGCIRTARAQTNQVPNLLGPIPTNLVPPGVSSQLPAFDSNGLDFTNVNYKAATGMEYENSGGVLSYLQADADVFKLGALDLGFGAEATLSGTGSGLHTVAGEFELIKNFSNFQLVGKAGIGGLFDSPQSVFGDVCAEINYNLTKGTGAGFLGGANGFTYVGANVELQVAGFSSGNAQLEKVFRIFAGFAF